MGESPGVGWGGNQLLVAPVTRGCHTVPRGGGWRVKSGDHRRDTRARAHACTVSHLPTCAQKLPSHTDSHRHGVRHTCRIHVHGHLVTQRARKVSHTQANRTAQTQACTAQGQHSRTQICRHTKASPHTHTHAHTHTQRIPTEAHTDRPAGSLLGVPRHRLGLRASVFPGSP